MEKIGKLGFFSACNAKQNASIQYNNFACQNHARIINTIILYVIKLPNNNIILRPIIVLNVENISLR